VTDAALNLVDLHSHVIPGVDDGARDEAESVGALRALVDQGVTCLVATPHIDGSLTMRPEALQQRLAEIDAGWAVLETVQREHFAELVMHRGAEVMLDTPDPDLREPRLRLAGGSFVLVEYPFMIVPPRSAGLIRGIVESGLTPIVAHPERYHDMTPRSTLPAQWRAAGALLQVNAGSLTGRYGPHARQNALALLEFGLADFVGSDFHARGRPSLKGARALLLELNGMEQAELLTRTNPRRLLDGQQPAPVPPLRQQAGLMRRFKRWLQ
jgi:protein-tyrosine phosphatase